MALSQNITLARTAITEYGAYTAAIFSIMDICVIAVFTDSAVRAIIQPKFLLMVSTMVYKLLHNGGVLAEPTA